VACIHILEGQVIPAVIGDRSHLEGPTAEDVRVYRQGMAVDRDVGLGDDSHSLPRQQLYKKTLKVAPQKGRPKEGPSLVLMISPVY